LDLVLKVDLLVLIMKVDVFVLKRIDPMSC